MEMRRPLAIGFALLTVTLVGCGPADEDGGDFDLVIANGRVMDPESGLDAVRTIGIRGGSIATIADGEMDGARIIDATGLVVAPGFVDLHEHAQHEESYALMVRDGVTSALELEVGTADVGAWYAEREGGQIVNYGVSIGHIGIRMDLLDGLRARAGITLPIATWGGLIPADQEPGLSEATFLVDMRYAF